MALRPFLALLLGCFLATPAGAAHWQPIVSPFDQLFPALVIATATMPVRSAPADRVLGDANGLIGAYVRATHANQRARLVVRVPDLARESELSVVLPEAGKRYALYPTLRWDFDRLHRVRAALPSLVELELFLDGASAGRQTRHVRLRSVNDAPYYVADDAPVDLNWMFAAYVNEDHPLVQRILDEALATRIVDRFDGYQSGDPERVYRQVFAIWHVLQRRGIRYSSITRTSSVHDKVLSQHVRFLDESWENAQANCVDGSVLLASVLRKIDLDPSLVLVPGHMFVAFDLDADGRGFGFLDTTLLGAVKRERNGRSNGLTDASNGDVSEADSLASFEAAVERGSGLYAKAAGRFEREDEPEYRIVDIGLARQNGVTPIAYKR